MRSLAALAAGAVIILTVTAASAETLYFSYTTPGNASGSASWNQSSAPIVESFYSGIYTTVSVSNGSETYPETAPANFSSVYFASQGSDGGFNTLLGKISPSGPQLYSGSESSPIFSAGTYTLDGGTLTVTGVPEPITWSMMLMGVAGLGALLRARRDRRYTGASSRSPSTSTVQAQSGTGWRGVT